MIALQPPGQIVAFYIILLGGFLSSRWGKTLSWGLPLACKLFHSSFLCNHSYVGNLTYISKLTCHKYVRWNSPCLHCRLGRLGGLDPTLVIGRKEAWRLISCIWLHAGVAYLFANMLSLLFIGLRLEQEFGFCKNLLFTRETTFISKPQLIRGYLNMAVRIGLLYHCSGFGGSLLSALSYRPMISVGASGALLGLLGAMLSELITNWTIYTNKVTDSSHDFTWLEKLT